MYFSFFNLLIRLFQLGHSRIHLDWKLLFKKKKSTGPFELYEWVKSYVSGSLAPTEGVAVYLTYQAIQKELKNQELSKHAQKYLQRLDQKLTLSKMSSESREGGIKIGKRYLKIDQYLISAIRASTLCSAGLINNLCYGNSSIVHGWITAYLEVQADFSVFTHLYVSVNNLLQSAITADCCWSNGCTNDFAKTLSLYGRRSRENYSFLSNEDDLFSYSIIQEIEAMRHETLYSRLFMS